MKLVDKLGQALSLLRPSLFDLLIIGILGIPFIHDPFHRGSYLIFYTLFLLCISFVFRPKNNYKSIPLTILLITSLILIFFHRLYRVVEHSIMNAYFNVAIMSEGFIYVLAGCVLFIMVVRYSTNFNFILLCALIASIPCIHFMLSVGSPVSLALSFIISLAVYLALNKKYRFIGDIVLIAVLTTMLNWQFIVSKATCRPDIWKACIKEIIEHPFIGRGFNYTIMPDGLFEVGQWKWVYRHNDYLYIWSALGIVAFISVVWWTIDCLRRIGKTIYLIPFLMLVLLCNFKETMLIPERAAIVIVICACCVKATIQKGEV